MDEGSDALTPPNPDDPIDLTDARKTFSEFCGTSEQVMARYTRCALCGGNLHFSHLTDFSRNLTQETASCPECGIRVRKLLHRLQ